MSVKVYHLGGIDPDSNVYLIDDEMLTLVDAGTGMNTKFYMDKIKELGFDPSDIDILVNTHCHFDHAAGDFDFFEESECEILIHEIEAEILENGEEEISCAVLFDSKLRPVKVEHRLDEGNTLDLGSTILEVLHTPGHTAGSICLYDRKNRALFTGDTVFCGGVGRTDLPTGNPSELSRSLERLSKLPVNKLYPGHGPLAEEDGEEFIFEAVEFMKALGEP